MKKRPGKQPYNGEKLLVIGAGPLQTPAIIRAKEMGLTVLATDMDPAAPGFARSDGHAVISTTDAAATAQYAAREKINGALTLATDLPLLTVAAVSEKLNLGIITTAAARRATNKYIMKKTLAAARVPCPGFIIASTLSQAADAAETIGWPIVTKPVFGSASRGVKLIHNIEQLESAFAQARQIANRPRVLIEEFARGRHVCVEAFTWKKQTRIICSIDRLLTPPPQFVELRHTYPSTINKKQLAQIEQTAKAGIAALGIVSGPSHIDMILTPRGPLISEIGARLDGDYKSSHFMPLVFGYDIIADAIHAAMGREPVLFSANAPLLKPKCAVSIHYFTPRPGIVKTISGETSARRSPGVKHLELNLKRGDTITPFTRSQDRIGLAIATATTAKAAEQSAKTAEGKIKITYTD